MHDWGIGVRRDRIRWHIERVACTPAPGLFLPIENPMGFVMILKAERKLSSISPKLTHNANNHLPFIPDDEELLVPILPNFLQTISGLKYLVES